MWDEAIREFREALRINPDDPAAHYNLGLTFEKESLRIKHPMILQ